MSGPWIAIWASWAAVFVLWIAKARGSKPTARSQAPAWRNAHVAAVGLVLLLMAFGPKASLYQASAAIEAIGAMLTATGCALAMAARLQLGRNWSPHAVLKHDQALLDTGTYAVSRHPIYTGLLTALFGTALALAQLRGWLALATLLVSFLKKAKAEEALLQAHFGHAYASYRQRVKQLIPFVW